MNVMRPSAFLRSILATARSSMPEIIRVARNPDYWKPGRPYLDSIEFSIIASRATVDFRGAMNPVLVSAIPLGTTLVPGSPARGMALMFTAGTFGRALASIPATRWYAQHGMGWPAVMCAVLATGTVAAMLRLRALGRP